MKTVLFVVACTACLCSTGACSRSVDFERMRQQARVDPYGSSGFFADRMAMRHPPAGTLARDADGTSVSDPRRGREQFDTFCAVCHGADGSGHSVMSSNLPQDLSLSLVEGRAAQLTEQELFDSISRGKDRMPGFAWAMPAADRRAVVEYVQQLRQRVAATGEDVR